MWHKIGFVDFTWNLSSVCFMSNVKGTISTHDLLLYKAEMDRLFYNCFSHNKMTQQPFINNGVLVWVY